MSDLIERQAAIEIFTQLWDCIGTIMDRDEWEDVCKTTANELPSAQPEIVRCKDCKHYGDDHFCCYPWRTTPEEFCSRGERRE